MKTLQEVEEAISVLREELKANGQLIHNAASDDISEYFKVRRVLRQRLWALKWVLGLFDESNETPEKVQPHQIVEII